MNSCQTYKTCTHHIRSMLLIYIINTKLYIIYSKNISWYLTSAFKYIFFYKINKIYFRSEGHFDRIDFSSENLFILIFWVFLFRFRRKFQWKSCNTFPCSGYMHFWESQVVSQFRCFEESTNEIVSHFNSFSYLLKINTWIMPK